MLKRTSIWLDGANVKALEGIARRSGGIKPAQLVRIAVHEFVLRTKRREAK